MHGGCVAQNHLLHGGSFPLTLLSRLRQLEPTLLLSPADGAAMATGRDKRLWQVRAAPLSALRSLSLFDLKRASRGRVLLRKQNSYIKRAVRNVIVHNNPS